MSRYRRPQLAGATYFFTVASYRRRGILTHTDALPALREAIRAVRQRLPFRLDALVILPDHLHALLTLPPEDGDYATRWSLIKRQAAQSARHLAAEEQTASRRERRELGFWQRRFWEHRIRDEADYARRMDYAYYNPVKHGLVSRVADWPHSTFHRDVRLGVYPRSIGQAKARTRAAITANRCRGAVRTCTRRHAPTFFPIGKRSEIPSSASCLAGITQAEGGVAMHMESYVVRVYRREKQDPQQVVGIVEAPETRRQAAFHGLAQLSAILAAPRRHLRRAGGGTDRSTLVGAPGAPPHPSTPACARRTLLFRDR